MTTLVSVFLFVVGAALLGMMLRQYIRGTHDLLSFRNFAIIGFVVFQVFGPVGALMGNSERTEFMLAEPISTSLKYLMMLGVFVALFFWTYRRGFFVTRLASLIPKTKATPSDSLLWTLAIVLVVLGMGLKFGVNIPLISALSHTFGLAFAAAACGIIGWIWGPRLFNPAVMIPAAFITICAAIVAMTGQFGRRPLVAVGAALLWGMYFSHWRYLEWKPAVTRFILVAAVPVIFIGLVSTVRTHAEHDRNIGDQISAIRSRGDVVRGLGLLFKGQDAGENSLWLIEQYPQNFETRYFHTIWYTIVYPVPRGWWEEKPEPLSSQLPHMARVQQVNRDALTLGPGIIGHAAAEGGWIALIVYGLIAGLFIRLLDELHWYHASSPLAVAALGSSFGQVVGFARGETAAFVALFLIGVTFTYLTMVLLGKTLERISGNLSMNEEMRAEEDEWSEVDWDADWTGGEAQPAGR